MEISAIVVGLNEALLLDSCLDSISFCKEIWYFDLGSKDNSIEIACKHGAKIEHHERVLSCEWIHSKYAHLTSCEWVLIIDPDEVVDAKLAQQIINHFQHNSISSEIGAISVPWRFYFKNRCLKGTPWGGANSRFLIVNHNRFKFTSEIHVGRKLLPGYQLLQLKESGDNVVHHYWMRDFKMLLSKHKRYLQNEGQARYNNGVRTSLFRILYTPATQFYFSFINKKGYKDFGTGLLLSVFWSWYQTNALIQLYKFQKKKLL